MGKFQGELVEIKFLLRARERGYNISKPFGDNLRYDFILDNGLQLLKIQVKGTRQKPNRLGCIQIGVGYGKSSKHGYTEKDVDLFAVYLQCIDAFYLIPSKIINRRVTIRIYPKRKICTWQEYRENWVNVQKLG